MLASLRNGAESILKLVAHIVYFFLRLQSSNTLVSVELLNFVKNIFGRNVCIHVKVRNRVKVFCYGLALPLLNSRVKHLAIKIVSDSRHMAVLAHAENVAGAANLKVSHCNLVAASEIRKLSDSLKSLLRNFFKNLVSLIH